MAHRPFLVTLPPGISSSLRQSSPPVPNGDLGTLSLRRRFINQTGSQITKLRFRITDLTTINKVAWAIFGIIPLVPFIYVLTGGDLF